MDFHSLTRRALQSLCKKNKIQANMTNVAMAEALGALPTVEGIEEFQVQHQLSSRKKAAARPEPEEEPQQQGSPLPRSRRVTARAPRVSRPGGGSSSEEEGKAEGATTTLRRTTRRRSAAKEAGDAGVGARRSTRGRAAASKMADLRTEEEEEEAKDALEALPTVEGIEEFQESQQHSLSSRKAAARPEPEEEPQLGSPLPRSRRVTARAPRVSRPGGSSSGEEEGKEEKAAGATTTRRRATRRRSATKETGDVDVGTRRSTRGRAAASKMADLRTEEEEEEAKDVVENVVSNDRSTGEMETKQGEGKKETNGMLPVEQPKEDQIEEEEAEFSDGGTQEVEHTSVLNDELGVEAAQMNSVIDQNRDSEEGEEEEAEFSDGGIQEEKEEEEEEEEEQNAEQNRDSKEGEEEAEFSDGGIQVHSVANDDEAAKLSNGGIQVLNDELGVEAAQMNAEISVIDQNRGSEEEEEEEADFSVGEIQEVEEHHSVLNEEEAAKFSNGGIQVVEHSSEKNDELGVEAAQTNVEVEEEEAELSDGGIQEVEEANGGIQHTAFLGVEAAQTNDVEISVIDQNSDSEEEEEEQNAEEQNRDSEEGEEEEEAEFSNGGIQVVEEHHSVLNEEEAAEFSNGGIQVEEHTAQTNVEISVIDQNRDSEEEEEQNAEEQNRDSEEEEAKFSNGGIQEVLNEEEAAEFSNEVEAAQTNVEISMIDQNRDSEEEEDKVTEDSTTFQGSPIRGLISSEPMIELNVDVGADQTSQVGINGSSSDDISPARLVQEDGPGSVEFVNASVEEAHDDLAVESEKPGNASDLTAGENEQSSHGDDEEESPDNSYSAAIDNYEDDDTTEQELENTNESGGGGSAIDIPVQIEDFGDEGIVVSGHLVGEIAVEAAAEVLSSKESPVNINNNNKENGLDDDVLRKEEARLEKLSLRKLKAMYKDTLNKNKGEEKMRSALQALDENCLSLK